MKLYYIHGYNSSVNSETFKMLQREYKDAVPLTYDANNPVPSIEKMVQIVCNDCKGTDEWPIIIGSSLGGWYAAQMTKHVLGDYIFYNPCIDPVNSLAKYGLSQQILEKYVVAPECDYYPRVGRVVILSVDDEVISYKKAESVYKDIAKIKYANGGHRMTSENMKIITDTIREMDNTLCL